ncbi:MAG: hypothetical protein ACJ77F_11525 [Chloroflexota bacterium]
MQNQTLLTPQSVAAMTISGIALMLLGILGGARIDLIAVGAALLAGVALLETIDNRRLSR